MVSLSGLSASSWKNGSRTDTGLGCSCFSWFPSGEICDISSSDALGLGVFGSWCSGFSTTFSGELRNISTPSLPGSSPSVISFNADIHKFIKTRIAMEIKWNSNKCWLEHTSGELYLRCSAGVHCASQIV